MSAKHEIIEVDSDDGGWNPVKSNCTGGLPPVTSKTELKKEVGSDGCGWNPVKKSSSAGGWPPVTDKTELKKEVKEEIKVESSSSSDSESWPPKKYPRLRRLSKSEERVANQKFEAWHKEWVAEHPEACMTKVGDTPLVESLGLDTWEVDDPPPRKHKKKKKKDKKYKK